MEQRKNARVRETGDPRETRQPVVTFGTIPTCETPGSYSTVNRNRFALVGGERPNLCPTPATIMLQSLVLSESTFFSNWHVLGSSGCRTIVIMCRAQKPVIMRAGFFAVMSLQTFLSVSSHSSKDRTVIRGWPPLVANLKAASLHIPGRGSCVFGDAQVVMVEVVKDTATTDPALLAAWEKNPPTNGIIRHNSHLPKVGDRTRFALVGGEQANHSATVASCSTRGEAWAIGRH
ncbi:hypothetical protein PR048_023028 [Dryococelus australis]|uniref:Uncharacterized protein n=1 Tax=Dryococelus australis TaxID=614101 RepID=A0ABQ9GSX9_9NEOP|nr:hypothetical protein PR048_023028 [Dryococelus australis]